MNYEFPYILKLDHVLPAIKGNEAFHVTDKGDYITVNYRMLGTETFPDIQNEQHAIMRECRGITFNKHGYIISRPFHKFFNYGERVETTVKTNPLYILDKLDGSMIRPIRIGKTIRLATKAGITDVAMQAEVFVASKRDPREQYMEFMQYCIELNCTPIFEWCSNKQKIVVDYPKDKLVLLAIRHNYAGTYINRDIVKEYAADYNIPLVESWYTEDIHTLVSKAKALPGTEGFILVYPNGHMIKAKSDWYVTLHKSKELIQNEKDVLKVIMNGELDDLKPLLSAEDLAKVNAFESKVMKGLTNSLNVLQQQCEAIAQELKKDAGPASIISRKEFARLVSQINPLYRPYMFKLWDDKDLYEEIKYNIIKHCGSRTKLEDIRWLIGEARIDA